MNATAQHTPGPWTLLEEGDELIDGSTPLTICGPYNDDLMSVYSSADATVNITRAQAVANAQLIATAPDMHAFIAQIARMTPDGEGDFVMGNDDAVDTLSALIGQARDLAGRIAGAAS